MSRLLKMITSYSTDSIIILRELLDHLRITNDNTRRIKIIIQSHTLTQKLRREQQSKLSRSIPSLLLEHTSILNIQRSTISNWNCRLDDHCRIRINLQHQINHILNMMRIKEILLRIIISRSCNNHKLRI